MNTPNNADVGEGGAFKEITGNNIGGLPVVYHNSWK